MALTSATTTVSRLYSNILVPFIKFLTLGSIPIIIGHPQPNSEEKLHEQPVEPSHGPGTYFTNNT